MFPLQRFRSNPFRGTLTAFAKVSNVLSEAFLAPTDPQSAVDIKSSIEEAEMNVPTVFDSHFEDPEFLFVDQKVN